MSDMRLRMSKAADEVLSDFAETNNITKAEALSRAIALLALAREQRAKGRFLGVVEQDEERRLRAVGLVEGAY